LHLLHGVQNLAIGRPVAQEVGVSETDSLIVNWGVEGLKEAGVLLGDAVVENVLVVLKFGQFVILAVLLVEQSLESLFSTFREILVASLTDSFPTDLVSHQ
jgi:hypothetical protein